MKKIRVVLADDYRLFRDGLRRLLELESDITVLGEAGDGLEALRVVREKAPDVLLLDIDIPKLDGVQIVRELSCTTRGLEYVAIAPSVDEERLTALSAAGVRGYVLKSSGVSELVSALRSVARGDPYVDPKVTGDFLVNLHCSREERYLLEELTPKEREVLYWISQGMNNADIAGRMVLSEKTVKNHVSHILRKLELKDRTQAAVMAWRTGLAQAAPLANY
ncbi:MAG: response regulator transcription factor [Synergistales bacterium]|nr:response regulator transcription factor [Synergistales bacterium]